MRKLLVRWAVLESDRCEVARPGRPVSAWVRSSAAEHRIRLDNTAPYELAKLLAAVIEAITSKGWDCRLTSSQRRAGEWHAIVWRHGERQPTFRPSLDGFANTPAAALLTAYLAALEAEADQ